MRKSSVLLGVTLLLASCATNTLDPNYAAQIEAYASIERAKIEVQKEQSRANEQRYMALQEIAKTGDANTRALAVMALAFSGGITGTGVSTQAAQVPQIPETQSDKAYKWTALFAAPVTNIASAWFGYSLGKTQSNNAANTTIAGYNTFGLMATSGFRSNTDIAGMIQAPQPNYTLSGAGVIGDGSYNSGRITSPNNCTTGNAQGGMGSGTTSPVGGFGTAGSITGC